MNDIYKGEKIRLRAYTKDDIKLAHEYINNSEIRRNLISGIPFPLTLEEEEKWISSISAFKDIYSFAIETLDGEYIGGCGINEVDWKNRVVTIGIFIAEKFMGKGYGTDAMKVLVRFVFEQMNANKVKLNVFSFNKRAIRCYEKCGFKLEGILRQEIFRDGKYHDNHIMSILREEYFTNQ